jgi:hypothetical protein
LWVMFGELLIQKTDDQGWLEPLNILTKTITSLN